MLVILVIMAAPPLGIVAAARQQSQWLQQRINPGNCYVNRWRRDYIATLLDTLILSLEECRKKREQLMEKINTLKVEPNLKE